MGLAPRDERSRCPRDAGCRTERFGGNLLAEPDDIRTKAGEPFKVYTPFWRELSGKSKLAPPIAAPARIPFPGRAPAGDELASWNLLPAKPDWTGGMRKSWEPGEQGALKRFNAFIAGFRGYAENATGPTFPPHRVSRLICIGVKSIRRRFGEGPQPPLPLVPLPTTTWKSF